VIEELRLALSKKDFGGLASTIWQLIFRRGATAKIGGQRDILGSTKLAKLFAFTSFAPYGATLDTYL